MGLSDDLGPVQQLPVSKPGPAKLHGLVLKMPDLPNLGRDLAALVLKPELLNGPLLYIKGPEASRGRI
jgi:hypothetical protein